MRAAGPSGLAFVIKRPHDWPCAGTACVAAARRPRTLAATGPQALAADPAQPHSKKSGHQSCWRGACEACCPDCAHHDLSSSDWLANAAPCGLAPNSRTPSFCENLAALLHLNRSATTTLQISRPNL